MKKKLAVILFISIILSVFNPVSYAAAINFKISVDGKAVTFPKEQGSPFLEKNIVMAPVSQIAYSMGFRLVSENNAITIYYKDSVKMQNCLIATSASDYRSNRELAVIDVKGNVIKTNKGNIKMDAAMTNKGGIHYIPVVSFCQAFGFKVNTVKKDSNYTVSINKILQSKSGKGNISNEDGTQSKGVRPVMGTDISKNPYLVNFMKQHFQDYTYDMYFYGLNYSQIAQKGKEPSINSSISLSQLWDYSGWQIRMRAFDDDKEMLILKAMLTAITGDADEIYDDFSDVENKYNSIEEARQAGEFDDWRTIGNTKFRYFTDENKYAFDIQIIPADYSGFNTDIAGKEGINSIKAVTDGVQKVGVTKADNNTDLRKNPFLVNYMRQFSPDKYDIYPYGIKFSPFTGLGLSPDSASTFECGTYFGSSDTVQGWTFDMFNFDEDQELLVFKGFLTAVTGDADKVYGDVLKLVKTYSDRMNFKKLGIYDKWHIVGKTKYMYQVHNVNCLTIVISPA